MHLGTSRTKKLAMEEFEEVSRTGVYIQMRDVFPEMENGSAHRGIWKDTFAAIC